MSRTPRTWHAHVDVTLLTSNAQVLGMPRLNYGTLLENAVVFDAVEAVLCETEPPAGGGSSLVFASSFAMPPLTQCWVKEHDLANSPYLGLRALQALRAREQELSLASLWSRCVENAPRADICRYRGDAFERHEVGGPNGALLAAMVAGATRRGIALWVNDDGARYGDPPPGAPRTDTESPRTLERASALLEQPISGKVRFTVAPFPSSVSDLAQFLAEAPTTAPRVGFLDPDNYSEGDAQVSPSDHETWLRALAVGCDRAVSITFMAVRNRGAANVNLEKRLARFHADETRLFPRSLVFEYGNFLAGVRIRWPAEETGAFCERLRSSVQRTWSGWSARLGPLTIREYRTPSRESAE